MWGASSIWDGQTVLYFTSALTFLIGAIGGYIAASLRLSQVEFHRLQLRRVRTASFHKQKLMNFSEFRVFSAIEQDRILKQRGLRLMAQPSLGEVLNSTNKWAFKAINSKRVDLLIIDRAGWPVLAIEYQGEGHHDNTSELRDEIKSTALTKAGVGYLEIFPTHRADDITSLVYEALQRNMALRGDAHDLQQALKPHFGRAANGSV